MPDGVVSSLVRLFSVQWNGLPVASLAIFAVGGLMYAAMSLSTRPASSSTHPVAVRRPGWIARRRARGGIGHRRDRVGVGYTSAVGAVHLSVRELAGHGAAFGGPGSGKTTFLQLLVDGMAGQMPVVVVDPKGSPALADTVRAHGGQVWTLDGRLPVDLLDPRPWQVPDLLLEAEEYSTEARVFRDAAHQRALWAAWALALRGDSMDLGKLRRLLDRDRLSRALEPFKDRDDRVAQWLDQLGQRDGTADSGARDLERSIGTLLDGVAMRGSLGTGPEALRLDDVLATRGLLLFSLDVADYPHATRKIAAWVLLAMGRLARQLVEMSGRPDTPRALLLVDEVGALGRQAHHLRGLVGRAREAGLSVVLATQGPSDLEAVDRALLPQVLQDTAWQLAFRQGSPQDAERMQAVFGKAWVNDESWSNDGRVMTRRVERPRVAIDEWMNALEPGDAWLRVAPVDRGWRQARVRVALPSRSIGSVNASVIGSVTNAGPIRRHYPRGVTEPASWASNRPALPAAGAEQVSRRAAALPPKPPDCPPELVERIGADILAKVDRRWPKHHHELGPCLVWREGLPASADGRYGRMYDPAIGKTDYVHRIVWRRCFGPIPKGKDVDHKCNVTLCERPDHFQALTKPENTRKRHQRTETTPRTSAKPKAVQRFAVALFAGVDRTTVGARALTLEDLVALLNRFEVLDDKRRGRCWSPTDYAPGHTTRGNSGVAAVTALVFDLDRVPPDPERLAGVCWIGHTTWSHTSLAPRWRVAFPLAEPVPVSQWRDVWLRARAALCPEADPSCKDPSRQYYVPAHAPDAPHEAMHHPGAMLDPSTLPDLPETRSAELRRSPSAKVQRMSTGADRRRGDAYMSSVIAGLETTGAGGRNAALNRAAWTLGRWVAAGALEQADVEDQLYTAAVLNGLVGDDGDRQCWATIRSGLGAGLQEPIDLDASRG